VTDFVLTVLKFAFVGLLYLFVIGAIRSVVNDVRGRPPKAPTTTPAPKQANRRRTRLPSELVVIDERGKRGPVLPMTGTIQIGRAEACHLRLPDSYVSQFHAKVFARDGGWFVEDLGSTNGTFLNEHKVAEPAALSPGDHLRVGKTVIEVRS
jgi:pSer/pThr/pTyr-binding forkhead associated (FHA) protein